MTGSDRPRLSDMPRHARGLDRGAAVVETAIVAPIVLLLLFGIIEFGMLFGQRLDVSQGAREGARLASVNYSSSGTATGAAQTSEIITSVCTRLPIADSASVAIAMSGAAVGDTVTVTVTSPFAPITGVYDTWLASRTLRTDVTSRLEQVPTFTATGATACP